MSALITGQQGEVGFAKQVGSMAEFEQSFRGTLKFAFPGTVEPQNLSNNSIVEGLQYGDIRLHSFQCTYYSLKAVLLQATAKSSAARSYAQECISLLAGAHTNGNFFSIHHALALALITKLYLLEFDYIAVLGVLYLLEPCSKPFESIRSIISKALHCLPQRYRGCESSFNLPLGKMRTQRYCS